MRQHEQWQIGGNAPESYERHLVPAMFTPWAHDLIARAGLKPGERVLDMACGTGIVARLAAGQIGDLGHVVGADLNPAMIEIARAHASASGARVEWQEANAMALPWDEGSFDVVLCQQGLQFIPDKEAALREMYRVLEPGGRLALSVWRSLQHAPWERIIAEALERHVSPEAGAGMRTSPSFGDAEALRALITKAGFREVCIHIVILTMRHPMRHPSPAEFISGQLAALPFAGAIAALEASAQAALLNDILAATQPYTDDQGLAVPKEAHVAVALK